MDKVTKDVEDMISQQIRPQLQAHGGDIKLLSIKNNVVTVQLLGACSSCPSNQQTVSYVIEETIHKKYPNIAVNVDFGVSDELIHQALAILRKSDATKHNESRNSNQ